METFTGFEYLLIECANHFGMDKKLFADRINWTRTNLAVVETLAAQADDQPRFRKVTMAIRKAQQGIPSGHLVGFDACCSGMQIMSAITGCMDGARATGLIDQNVRADAYTIVTDTMIKILGVDMSVSRQDAKDSVMTSLYGSKKEPKRIFGEDTPELNAFYEAMSVVCPGAWGLLQELLESWQPFALVHEWKLPDGYDARVKVMTKVEARIEVDELDHATFTYQWKENTGKEKGLSNVANVIHSIDAYVLRSLVRRCNYDKQAVWGAIGSVGLALQERRAGKLHTKEKAELSETAAYYRDQYDRSGMPDVVIAQYLTAPDNARGLSTAHLEALLPILDGMYRYVPFEIVSVHDEFQCHANNMNHLRQQYNNILADLADSNIIGDILGQIHGCAGTYTKLSNNLSSYIRKANYALS
jgi:hypothetical protein